MGQSKRTMWQRLVLRRLRRRAGKGRGEPLGSEDWKALWELNDTLGHGRCTCCGGGCPAARAAECAVLRSPGRAA